MAKEQRIISGKMYFLDGEYPDRHSAQIAINWLKAEGFAVNMTISKFSIMSEIEVGTNGHKYYRVWYREK